MAGVGVGGVTVGELFKVVLSLRVTRSLGLAGNLELLTVLKILATLVDVVSMTAVSNGVLSEIVSTF